MSIVVDTDVLIVGAGPAGLTAAALLARQGVSAITVSKYPSTANTPRAHITNQRTLEVMRDLGIEELVYQHGQKMPDVPENVWVTSLAGRELARRKAWGTRVDRRADYDESSPSSMVNIGQHVLEPLICRRALESGADIRFQTELVEIGQDADAVTAVLKYRPTGETYRIRAKYVIGADGGRSTVADQIDFEHDGPTKMGYALNAWIEADLTRFVEHRPGILYWTNHPGRDYFFGSGSLLVVSPWNEWVVQFSYDPSAENLEATEEMMLPRVQTAIGDPSVPVKIKGLYKWEVNAQIARDYRIGRVFIAGDAAHRHSPANGLGSNTSIQDSYNLAWKLAAVLQGNADDSLLDSYHSERQPIGAQIVDRATRSMALVGAVPGKLGIQSGQAEEEGWAAVDGLFAPTAEARQRRDELQAAVDEWEYGYNCHGVEMGQRYTEGALVDDGTPFPPYERDGELYYHPTTHPGAYLPHVWLNHDGTQVSTLDVVPADTWTLITGVEGQAWADAAADLSAKLGIGIATRAVGHGLEFHDVYGDWAKTREITDGGCLLVRPDRHIAWRAADASVSPATDLREAFGKILRPGSHD
ncbi:FAD-dependent monooxygenase [Streptomyces justiciae]|uniref:FAD-dependent monooxygenase n=1 Tax=Streptomyces justiciae TaxID=2780140 RepID=UPI0021180982|nr:FAD-dependent monooxygenase [Streptomyces justiciae]MCW8378711.1 FAD-dependent monooxygenase [Streptomyces justiciae]